MLKVQEIREIIKLVDQSSISDFEYEHAGSKITMKKSQGTQQIVTQAVEQVAQPATIAPAAVQVQAEAPVAQGAPAQSAPATKEVDANLHKIVSPMVGTFYSSPSPDADSYVKTGDKVANNTVVCIVEAMKLFNEIEAEVKGEIVEILAENGQLVEFGQPLFLVKPE
jgi:acetyl-CoA carboxylase biotin carboxyl carrier protein